MSTLALFAFSRDTAAGRAFARVAGPTSADKLVKGGGAFGVGVQRLKCGDVELALATIVVHEPNLAKHGSLHPSHVVNPARVCSVWCLSTFEH